MATAKVKAGPSVTVAARAKVADIRVKSRAANSVPALRDQVNELAGVVERLADAVESLERREAGRAQG